MTRSTALLLTLLTLLFAVFGWIPEAGATLSTTGNINFLLGAKRLRYSDSDHLAGALDISCGLVRWPVLLNAYASGSRGTGETDTDGSPFTDVRYEAGIGLMGTWPVGPFHPHVGAGVGRITQRFHIEVDGIPRDRRFVDAEDHRWIAWGAFWRHRSGLNVGFAVRTSKVRHDPILGGTHYGLTLGWGWPGKP